MSDKNRFSKYYKFGVYLLVIVLVNVAGATLFLRADLTSNGVYSLSDASKQVVRTLSEPLTINVFFTRNLPAPHNNTERYLHDLLEEYAVHSNRYFNYRFYDVSAEEGDIDDDAKRNQQMARDYGIYPVQIQNIEQDEVKFQNAYMGLVMIHGDVIERIPTITSTEDLEYQLTSRIEKMNNKISTLVGMTEPVQLKLYFSSSLETIAPQLKMNGLMEMPETVRGMVDRLNDKYYGKLNLTVLDPATNPSLQGEIDRYNVLTLRWPAFKDRSGNAVVEAGSASAGLVIEKGEKFQSVALIKVINLPLFGTQYQMPDLDELEKQVGEGIDDVIDINKKIGYLSSHGTVPLQGMPAMPGMPQQQENLGNLNKLISNNYSVVNVDLKATDAIPEGIDCLIIAGPREQFNEYELFQIDQFLMKGKSLAIFLDAFQEMQMPQGQMQQYGQQPVYTPINTGIERLLQNYGVAMQSAYVLDMSCFEQKIPQVYGGGKRDIYFAPIIKNENINSDLPFMKNIKGLVMLMTAPVELREDRLAEHDLKGAVAFSSSSESWVMRGRINLNQWALQPPQNKDEMASQPLAVMVEGSFPSYFDGKSIPEKPVEQAQSEGEAPVMDDGMALDLAEQAPAGSNQMKDVTPVGAVLKRSAPGKVFLVGSAEILKNNVIDEKGGSTNSNFVMNVLDNLNARDEYAEMRSKSQQFNPLKDTGPGLKTFVKMFNIIGLPLIVVAFGTLVWVRRTARKRTIQTMFAR